MDKTLKIVLIIICIYFAMCSFSSIQQQIESDPELEKEVEDLKHKGLHNVKVAERKIKKAGRSAARYAQNNPDVLISTATTLLKAGLVGLVVYKLYNFIGVCADKSVRWPGQVSVCRSNPTANRSREFYM